jgi:hypothetical protein
MITLVLCVAVLTVALLFINIIELRKINKALLNNLKNAQSDLRAIMDGVKKIDKDKEGLRAAVEKLIIINKCENKGDDEPIPNPDLD